MAAAYNGQSVPYGSKVLTINSVAYVAENINTQHTAKVIERTNELDEPSGQVLINNFVTATATLQLAAAATAIPTVGLTCTATLDGASATWILSDVGVAYTQGDATKLPVTFRKAVS